MLLSAVSLCSQGKHITSKSFCQMQTVAHGWREGLQNWLSWSFRIVGL